MWDEEGLRSELVILSEQEDSGGHVEKWLQSTNHPQSVDLVIADLDRLSSDIVSATTQLIPDEALTIRTLGPQDQRQLIDVTDCEVVEHPLLDRYELVQETHLRSLLPEELSEEDLNSFFDRSRLAWAPYAAGFCTSGDVTAVTGSGRASGEARRRVWDPWGHRRPPSGSRWISG